MWPLGFSRVDVIAWGLAVVVGVVSTLIGWAAGARLGAALSVGVILMVAVVVTAMLIDAGGRSFRNGDSGGHTCRGPLAGPSG